MAEGRGLGSDLESLSDRTQSPGAIGFRTGIGGRIFNPGAKRGLHTGPNPTDRGKPGCKHHIAVDRQGIPLAATLSAANVHDSQMMEQTIDAIHPVAGRPGRPRHRPAKAHLDKGYDSRRCRAALRQRGIISRIARRGVESKERLGQHRWVVERTFAWLHAFRRLRIRYEQNHDHHLAMLKLACALICWRFFR